MKYRILVESFIFDMETQVEEKLKEGWKLQGGVSVVNINSSSNRYIQAMVKEE